MGTFDDEGTYDLFKVLRVKAYCSVKDDHLTITVSGVPKEEGSLELESKGGIISFDEGLIFQDSGRTGGIYNDDDYFHYNVDSDPAHSILITKNVCIIKAEYSMNLSTNYKEIVRALSKILDSKRYPDYTGRR